jgi:hypothetical protein
MYRNIDVMTEMRKLTDSKPVHAVAGAGVLASQTLKDLPGLLARWRTENPVTSLPSRATGFAQTAQTHATSAAQTAQARATSAVQTAQARANEAVQTAQARANEVVQTARAKAAGGYDTLAVHGKKALNGQPRTAQAKRTQPKSTAAAPGKAALNGKAGGKAPSSRTGH